MSQQTGPPLSTGALQQFKIEQQQQLPAALMRRETGTEKKKKKRRDTHQQLLRRGGRGKTMARTERLFSVADISMAALMAV